jgi:integrase
MRVHEVTELYISESGRVRTTKSADAYRGHLGPFQRLHPGRHVHELTAGDLVAFCLRRKADGSLPADNTIATRRSMVRALFKWLTRKGYIERDPSLELDDDIRPGRVKVRTGTWLTDEQVSKIYRSYDISDLRQHRDRTMLMIGLFSGLRCDELARLTWADFNANLTELRVLGKGRKIVDLPVAEQLHDELLAWRRRAPADAVAVLPAMPTRLTGNRTFTELVNWDKPLGSDAITDAVAASGNRLGIYLRPHDLRRSYAGWLESLGTPLKDIQMLMRHENLATTDRYLDDSPTRRRRALDGKRRQL